MTAKKTGLDLLEEVLDTYGAERTRWPAHVRLELSQLIAQSPQARRAVAEAQALDKLIDMAPAVPAQRVAALADRIAAQAARTPRVAATAAPSLKVQPVPHWRRHASGIAALAASLMIGIFAGQSQTMAPAVSELASVVGFENAAENLQLALSPDSDVAIDEDLL